MFIINAPVIFSGIWAVVKPWVDKKTRKKVHILGSGYLKELEKFIDIENIPEFLGGKADSETKYPFFSNPGPWNDYGKQHLFPKNDSEMIGLRFVFPLAKEKNVEGEEEKVDSEEEYMKDVIEEENIKVIDVKVLKTVFTSNSNWSMGLSKRSLSFKPNNPYSS